MSAVKRDGVLIPPTDCKSDGDCNGDGFDDGNRDSWKKTASFLGFGFGGDRDQIPPLGKLVANTPCKVAMQIVIVSVVLLKLILNDSDCIP